MPSGFQSTLLLTVLLATGLVFFLRAASKDRTTVVDVHSPRPPIEVLNGISSWLEQRGWSRDGGDAERQVLRFRGEVTASRPLAVLLSALAAIGGSCFGLVLRQLAPQLQWWPLALVLIGPAAGWIYTRRSARTEALELRLLETSAAMQGSNAHFSRGSKNATIAMRHTNGQCQASTEISAAKKTALKTQIKRDCRCA